MTDWHASTDCRWYLGEKPCRFKRLCPDCPHHAPRGAEILVIKLGALGAVLRTVALLPALRRAAGEKFLECIRADVAAIRRVLGGEAVARLGKTERGWQLRLYSREPAKAPRRAPERKSA